MQKRLIIGASADRSLTSVFVPFTEASKKARAAVQGDLGAIQAAAARSGQAAAKSWDAPRDALGRFAKAGDAAAQAQTTAAHRTAQAWRAAYQQIAVAADSASRQERAAADRSAAAARAAMTTWKGIAKDAGGTIGAIGRGAASVGRGALGGMGVDLSLESRMQKGIEAEAAAARATASALLGEGKTASAADVAATMTAVQGAANQAKLPMEDLASGVESFVSASGDIETVKTILGDIGDTARAAGADVGQLAGLAGDVNKALMGTVPAAERAARVLDVVRVLIKQGALGSVELKDMQQYAARFVSAGSQFEGSITKNIAQAGALAQIARGPGGGRSTAAEATNAAQRFGDYLKQDTTQKTFKNAGIEIWADAGQTQLRQQEKIIVDVLRKTQGDEAQIANLFKNVVAKAPVQGAAALYKEAGGGEAGIEAVRQKFRDMEKAVSAEDVKRIAAVQKEGMAATAAEINNELSAVALELGKELLPTIKELKPHAVALAKAFAELVGWAAKNPGEAIVVAITGGIAKAALGEAVKGTIVSALTGGLGGAGGLLGGAAGAGGLAMLNPLVIGAMAASIGLMLFAAHKESEREETRRRANIRDAEEIVDKDRQTINKQLGEAGIEVSPTAGLSPTQARGFGATQEESDRLEEAALKAQGPSMFGGGDASKAPAVPMFKIGEGGKFEAVAADQRAAAKPAEPVVPTLQELLAAQNKGNDLLARIAANSAAGPGMPKVGTKGREGIGDK